MKPLLLFKQCSCAFALLASVVSAGAQANVFFNVTNNGDFAVAANWNTGALPTGFGNTWIGSSALGSPILATATAYLTTDVTSLSTGTLWLGQGSTGNGTLTISNGGSLQYGLVYIGRDSGAVGTLNQLGGTNRVNTGTFEIQSGGTSGTYNLSGGVLNTIVGGAMAIKVGTSGSGTGYFNMSGGTFNAGTNFATQQHSLNMGWGAKGEAMFSAGTANLTGDLNAGNGSNGLVTISGTALVNARNVNVGLSAGASNSVLTVSGGTLSVTNVIKVDNNSRMVASGGTISAPALNIVASGSVTNSGGTINITSITNNGTLTFARTADYTNTSIISGGGIIVKQGTNTTLKLVGSNSFTNGMQVWEGTVALDDPASLGAGRLRLGRLTTTGTLRFTGTSNSTVTNNIQVGFGPGPSDGGAVLEASGAGAVTFSSLVAETGAQAARTLTLSGTSAGSNTISGHIADNNTTNGALVSLVKNGSGTWILAGNNTYSGNTTVNAGKLELAAGGSLSFVIGGNGTNSALAGTATTVMGGQFAFDLTGAATDTNAAWTIVAGTLTNSYGTNFLVAGFSGVNGGNWTNTTNGVNYVFSQPTGILSVQAAPTNSYTSWVAYWQGVDPGFTNTAGTDNPDGDPFDNNMEFAFDGNPTIGTGALLTAVTVGTNAVFNYVAMTNTNAVTYVVQSTANLTNGWTNASVVISNSLNQTNPVISQTNIYQRKEFVVPATSNNFYRVRAIF
jgi:fibronectin-binding autotransporter adhesin